MVKSVPTMWETQVQSLGWEDSPGEENGNPFQYSCLETPMDGGAWQTTVVYGVARVEHDRAKHIRTLPLRPRKYG